MQTLSSKTQYLLGGLVAVVVIALLGLFGFAAVYSNKILPGVSVNGVYAGGLTKQGAIEAVKTETANFEGQQIPVQYNQTTLRVPVSGLGVNYDEAAAQAALDYGRTGSLGKRLGIYARSILGRRATIERFSYNDDSLLPFFDQVDADVASPVANAALSFDGGQVSVKPSQPGRRVDRGRLVQLVNERLGQMDDSEIKAPVYLITPSIDETSLAAAKHQADTFVAGPLTATAQAVSQSIDQSAILSWIDVSAAGYRTDMVTDWLKAYYDDPNENLVRLTLSQPKVGLFVQQLAAKVNREPKNAGLSMSGGKLIVESPSKDGLKVDETKATNLIIAALAKPAAERTVPLPTANTKAAVNEGNLDTLGLKEMIGQGFSTFPGSSSARLTNVRVGQAIYDGLLIKPGEVFSFGAALGDVGPAQGYQPSLVIIGNKEEKQYGGGLCQVSSTLYRAALTAGLPIMQRINHAFAINEFYTAPYGVPGVDATIYYPQVDLKFKNDTPGYILIQTRMAGTTLTFDLYGTKTKTGVIRGPYFISGSMDATQPSHTVFYRDVLDLSGKVIKTDTTETYYKSSTDFTIVEAKQFN